MNYFKTHIADAACISKYWDLLKGVKHRVIWNRKLWEYLYILYQFDSHFDNKKDLNILCFGTGLEIIPAILSLDPRVKTVTISDGPENPNWSDTSQWIGSVKDYVSSVRVKEFDKSKLLFKTIDMNNLPSVSSKYDFLWSTSSLEHLGSMEKSIAFIVNSSTWLTNNGIACHATEFNDSKTTRLVGDSVYFRKQDILTIKNQLALNGFEMSEPDFTTSNHPYNKYIDHYPYSHKPAHMKLKFDGYVITSFGFCIRRKNEEIRNW